MGGVTYALSAGDEFSLGGLVGATAGGAIAGATVAISAPIGGTIAGFLGASSTGVAAVASTAGLNFLGGAVGDIAASVGAGKGISARTAIGAGFFNAGLGMIGNGLWSLRGVNTIAQARYFATRSWAGLVGGGTNSLMALRSASFGGIGATWWAALNIIK